MLLRLNVRNVCVISTFDFTYIGDTRLLKQNVCMTTRRVAETRNKLCKTKSTLLRVTLLTDFHCAILGGKSVVKSDNDLTHCIRMSLHCLSHLALYWPTVINGQAILFCASLYIITIPRNIFVEPNVVPNHENWAEPTNQRPNGSVRVQYCVHAQFNIRLRRTV